MNRKGMVCEVIPSFSDENQQGGSFGTLKGPHNPRGKVSSILSPQPARHHHCPK